jgi:hypothetical protein
MEQAVSSETGLGYVMQALATYGGDVPYPAMFTPPARAGYAVVQAFSKDVDVAYSACLSVSNAARGIANRWQRLASIVFPVLVIDGRLFEAYLDEKNELTVGELSRGRLVWHNRLGRPGYTVIELITKPLLESYAGEAFNSFSSMFSLFLEQ